MKSSEVTKKLADKWHSLSADRQVIQPVKFEENHQFFIRTNTKKCMMRITRNTRANWTSFTVGTLMPRSYLSGMAFIILHDSNFLFSYTDPRARV